MSRWLRLFLAFVLVWSTLGAHVAKAAEDLTIGLSAPITSLDPHFANNSPNKAVARHFFQALLQFDEKLEVAPALATAWRRTSDTMWEFQLRPNVHFSDGSLFTANDVVASFERAPNVPNSPASLALFTRSIKQVSVIDPLKVRIETKYPDPLLPMMMPEILMVPAANRNATTNDFNTGKTMVGTGPFVFGAYLPGDRIIMTRNERYWGKPADWSKVTLRFIGNEGARVAALLAGDVDLIENVPPDLIAKVKQNGAFQIVQSRPALPVYLGLDLGRDVTPFVTGNNPSPGAKANPLLDKRVRQALSYAIDRKAISERIMSGTTAPAGQMLVTGLFGTSNKVVPTPYDPKKAKALLTEAGYPNGLTLTLHGPNDRLANDSHIIQAIAQMWTRAGIVTKVEVMPWNIYFSKTTKRDFSIWMMSSGAVSEMATALNSVAVTHDLAAGRGVNNRGRYSNSQVDNLINTAFLTLDDAKRKDLLARASEIAMDDVAVMPLYFYSFSIASQKSISYVPRLDQFTLAYNARRTK
ncbi:MAG: family 5 extracellular solute-binding protein [Betaproteobacteria bacterium]|nr:family 5 extracellular solute-binding protein [Betaproteobacteria bacterium]